MTTRDTPEAAHRAEYDRALGGKSRARTLPGEHKDGIAKSALTLAVRTAWGCDYPRSTGGHQTCGCTDERIAAILAALDGWRLVPTGPRLQHRPRRPRPRGAAMTRSLAAISLLLLVAFLATRRREEIVGRWVEDEDGALFV